MYLCFFRPSPLLRALGSAEQAVLAAIGCYVRVLSDLSQPPSLWLSVCETSATIRWTRETETREREPASNVPRAPGGEAIVEVPRAWSDVVSMAAARGQIVLVVGAALPRALTSPSRVCESDGSRARLRLPSQIASSARNFGFQARLSSDFRDLGPRCAK